MTAPKTSAAAKPKKAVAKKAPKPVRTGRPLAATALPPLDPANMNADLLAVQDKQYEIDAARELLERLIGESDSLIKDAVDNGERYRDIAAAAGRTVPWVQMSLRRESGVATHPAKPIPATRVRRRRSDAS